MESIKIWLDILKNSNAKQSICLALLGNKDDLEENNKVVKKIDGEQMAKELNMPFYDVSALRGQNVELSFNEWIDSIIVANNGINVKKGSKIIPNRRKKKQCC